MAPKTSPIRTYTYTLFLFLLYQKLIHNATIHFNSFPAAHVSSPSSRAHAAMLHAAVKIKWRNSGSFGVWLTGSRAGELTGLWRPTNINGGISGVWEFEARGAPPAAARAWARCRWPPALRHRTGVYGVWGVCPPQKGLRPSSRGRKLRYKLVRHA